MSSATSTKAVPAPKPVDDGFRISHFFVLLSLVAATVAVMMARPSAPENLILVSLTIGAAGVAAIALYRTIAPLVDPHAAEDRVPLSARLRADLEREKTLTLRAIKELEFDRAMGKLSQQDFDQMAGRLRARAMGMMKQLDASESLYRREIERELVSRVGAPAGMPDLKVRPPTEDTRRPDLPAYAEASAGRQVRHDTRHCSCGTENDTDAKFCKHCGAKLTEGTE
jgi:hypothetical protein